MPSHYSHRSRHRSLSERLYRRVPFLALDLCLPRVLLLFGLCPHDLRRKRDARAGPSLSTRTEIDKGNRKTSPDPRRRRTRFVLDHGSHLAHKTDGLPLNGTCGYLFQSVDWVSLLALCLGAIAIVMNCVCSPLLTPTLPRSLVHADSFGAASSCSLRACRLYSPNTAGLKARSVSSFSPCP